MDVDGRAYVILLFCAPFFDLARQVTGAAAEAAHGLVGGSSPQGRAAVRILVSKSASKLAVNQSINYISCPWDSSGESTDNY